MPHQPAFVPIDIPAAIQTGIDFDTTAYQLSDEDFTKRFGTNLVPGREFSVDDAVRGITGQQSPVLTNAMAKAGLEANLGSTPAQQAKNLGKSDILAMDKRGRDYFQKTLALNPRRGIGPSGKNVSDMALANTGGHNMFNVANYSSGIASYNQQLAQQAANNAAYAKDAVSLAGLGASFFQPQTASPYLQPTAYGNPYGNTQFGYTGNLSTRPYGYGG